MREPWWELLAEQNLPSVRPWQRIRYRTKVAADDAEAEKDLDTAVEATYRIRSQYGVAGGLAGSVSGKLTVSGCVASVYVDGYDFAGGLVGKVVDNKGDQPARIENSYVGGHTSSRKIPGPSDSGRRKL